MARVQKWGFSLGAALATGRSTIPGNPRRKAPSDRAASERYDDRNAGYNASERFDDTDIEFKFLFRLGVRAAHGPWSIVTCSSMFKQVL